MKYRKFEIFAVLLTGLMKFLVIDFLEAKFWFIILAVAFWIVYISWRIYRTPTVKQEWGLSISGFRQTFKVLLIPALLMIIGSIWYGWSYGILIFNWHLIPVLLLYPFWGIVQQLLIIALFGSNIYDHGNSRIHRSIIISITASLFSLVHYPSIPLMVATFFLAICYCFIFFRFRNIIALGIFHGWLACVYYFFVLGRDPWMEFLGSI